jgi:hypothetical protein
MLHARTPSDVVVDDLSAEANGLPTDAALRATVLRSRRPTLTATRLRGRGGRFDDHRTPRRSRRTV